MTMRIALKLASISLIIMGLSCVPARAQLASYRDADGKLIFINADKPVKKASPAKAATAKPATDAGNTAAAQSQPATTGSSTQSFHPTPTIVAPMAPAALDRVVQQSAAKNHVDPALVRAVISTESNWNTGAVSSKGAIGLMQLTPSTAQRLGVGNAFDPAQNIGAGVQYLGMMLSRYKGDISKALAAYNAGPGAVDRFGGVPNFPETRHYVRKGDFQLLPAGREPRGNCVWGIAVYLSKHGCQRSGYICERMRQNQRPKSMSNRALLSFLLQVHANTVHSCRGWLAWRSDHRGARTPKTVRRGALRRMRSLNALK